MLASTNFQIVTSNIVSKTQEEMCHWIEKVDGFKGDPNILRMTT